MKKNIEHIPSLIAQLTSELKLLELWQASAPSSNALASVAPFCCDTLNFEQWLQFIFIPKISQMINTTQPLPSKIALTPMAEESFKYLGSQSKNLISIINKIDSSFSEQHR